MGDYEGMKTRVFGWSKEWNHPFQKAFHSLKIIPSIPMFFFHSIPSCTIQQQHHNPRPSPQPTTAATRHHLTPIATATAATRHHLTPTATATAAATTHSPPLSPTAATNRQRHSLPTTIIDATTTTTATTNRHRRHQPPPLLPPTTNDHLVATTTVVTAAPPLTATTTHRRRRHLPPPPITTHNHYHRPPPPLTANFITPFFLPTEQYTIIIHSIHMVTLQDMEW
ncbi:hypothetical protein HanRHA438_Chr09g0403971 [Helianthus annuus]|nr:hypothetical protein HanRHA438_Chr09g0403971 [Helianthus annuus]